MPYFVPPAVLPGNLLSAADCDFEATGFTWAADTNASAPARVASGGALASSYPLSGSWVLGWSAAAAGDTIISTGFYPCVPANGYAISGYLLAPAAQHDSFIGVRWYNSSHAHLADTWGTDSTTSVNAWQPLAASVTSPAGAAFFRLAVWVATTVGSGELAAVDLLYAAPAQVQVLADWTNPAFIPASQAGSDFMDLTPWVRMDQGVSYTRGRQDSVSEMQPGSATFYLQNDSGWFTKFSSSSPVVAIGGAPDIGARVQVNMTDQAGTWFTRFDGPVSSVQYTYDSTGSTSLAQVQATDVLAFLNRQGSLQCWTKEAVIASGPWLHWSLNDANNSGNLGNAAESSGNGGPALHPVAATRSVSATLQWASTNSGVETLADASAPGQPDMSDMWPIGSVTSVGTGLVEGGGPGGLESATVGPYSSPMPSPLFTPSIITTGGLQDNFLNSCGFSLVGVLTGQTGFVAPDNASSNYALECWFAADPNVWQYASQNTGPFIAVSLGASRTGASISAGLYPTAGVMEFVSGTYTQPPAYNVNLWGAAPPTSGQKVPGSTMLEKKSLIHHLVLNITGATTGGTVEMWLDGFDYGSYTLPVGVVYDTVTVGGAYGGYGNWLGQVSLLSLYQRVLAPAEIQQHCATGQFGMWEQTTDNAIAKLGSFAGIPQFWNNLTGGSNGLSLCDYYDVTNFSPLASMQIFEAAEQGLLYVNAAGALTFATRDWRMGYGAPDVLLPPDTYTPDLGYELIDQFLLNSAQVGTMTYQTGVSAGNSASLSRYGTYSNGGSSLANWNWSNNALNQSKNTWNWINFSNVSGIQLPLITWCRSYAQLGVPQYNYWSDPQLADYASWQVNSQGTPRLTYGTLTLDLLTLDPLSGLTITQLYGLDVGNMVALLSYDAMVLSYGPVAYYPLDDAGGADLAGNGGVLVPSVSNMAAFGAGPSPVASSPGCAFINPVSGVLASAYAPSGGSAWTAECWVNLSGQAQTGNPRLIASASPATDHTGFQVAFGGTSLIPSVTFGNGTTSGQASSATALTATGWHHVAGTWDGTTITIYVDGHAAGTAALAGTMGASAGTVTIAGPATGTGNYYTGLIGQCALTPVVFTATQVLARYQAAVFCQPASLANAVGANELFIEGVTENRTLAEWTLGLYTSPASTQRAWLPGHPVYGQLGASTRIGVSAPDLSTPQALGKDVSHDAGPPYWPPVFTGVQPASLYIVGYVNFTGTSGTLPVIVGIMHTYQGDTLLVHVMCDAASTITVGPDTAGNTYAQIGTVALSGGQREYIFASQNAAPLNSLDTIPVSGTVSQPYAFTLYGVENALALDAVHTNTGTSTTPSVSTGTRGSGYEFELVTFFNYAVLPSTLPAGWNYGQNSFYGAGDNSYATVIWRQAGSATTSDTATGLFASSTPWGAMAITFTAQPVVLNNPADNGHQFIGSLEMRGLHDNLAQALQPPMAVVGTIGHAQAIPTGNNSNPAVVPDNLYVDTVGAMSAVPSWTNWYTCLVPGFYELSGSVKYDSYSSGSAGTRTGYFGVARQAAQAAAAGTAGPTTVNSYVCPVGEQHIPTNFGVFMAAAPSTQVYLGLGDMVAMCTTSNQGASDNLGTWGGGSQASLRWVGNSTIHDQVMLNTSLGGSGTTGGGGGGGSGGKKSYTTSWTATGTFSYYGTGTSYSPQLRATNSNVWQGTAGLAATGSQFGFVVFPYAAIHSALSGATITGIKLKCTNTHTWYNSGATLMLGWSSRTSWPSSITPTSGGGDHANSQQFAMAEGATRTLSLFSWANAFSSTATSILVGNNITTSLNNYGYWGLPATWVLTISYQK